MKWIGRILLALVAFLSLCVAAQSGHAVLGQLVLSDDITTFADHTGKIPLPEVDRRCDLMLPVNSAGVPGIHFQQVAGSANNSPGHKRQMDSFKRYTILLYGRICPCGFIRENHITFLATSSLMDSVARRISNCILII
ncbi:MAG: hypothetical protein GX798_06205 [Bacteroidales bacterium]|jgi:hypothetical protein|nr:hypothetical protein [Bacteroidales bacterium]